ncbi:MAG TPA: hypothetical protein DEP35_24645 [Deltaproteobacteria bacterium]|nr:hypothetical protein [Deltaproteobacteria bacterium]
MKVGGRSAKVGQLLAKIGRQLRDAWVIAGLSFVLLFAIEEGYRCYERLPGPKAQATGTTPQNPYASEAWFPKFRAASHYHMGRPDSFYVDYDPYRGWWVRPGRHEDLYVEPSGYRHTEQSPRGDEATRRHVFLLGGSAMWGFTARDRATIPSWVARQLAAQGIDDVEIDNKAQCAFNLTQNIATLEQELRRGARPVAAVFLDGINEVGPVAEGEQPGDVYGQADARKRFALGHGSTNELLLALASNLHVVRALQALRPAPKPPELDVAAACEKIADNYLNLVRIGEALGREFGFTPLFFWQPALATSGKPLGPWEAHLMADARDPLVRLTKACLPDVEARLATRRDIDFFPLNAIFDHVDGDQFLDHYGHVTEQANGVIAAAITEHLAPVLREHGTEVSANRAPQP